MEMNGICNLCPRNCGVNRAAGQKGYCKETWEIRLARAALHFWEEPCISGSGGSGTVFFTGCSLGCVYCQNRTVSSGQIGKAVSLERLIDIFFELKEQGAHNINLVTPDHYLPQVAEALRQAKDKGLALPVVYNCSGYEKPESLRLLDGLVQIYLPDFKYWDDQLGLKYSRVPDYRLHASRALAEMVRQTGFPVFDRDGMMKQGVIVRHLVLPEHTEDSKNVIRYLYETYGGLIYISIMNQYTTVGSHPDMPELNRKLTEEEYDQVVDYAISLGVENGFIQEGETAEESFIPAFTTEGV